MIGKSLRARYASPSLSPEQARGVLTAMLPSQAAHLVQVRARGAHMVACFVVRADEATVRLCRSLGFEVVFGGTGVFGLLGEDAARLFGQLSEPQRAWLRTACGPRETKVLLLAGGIALMSLKTVNGHVTATCVA